MQYINISLVHTAEMLESPKTKHIKKISKRQDDQNKMMPVNRFCMAGFDASCMEIF